MNQNRSLGLIVVGLLFFGSLCAQSQKTIVENEEFSDKHKVITNHFFDNWFISVAGGGQVYFGANDSEYPFTKRITPTANAYIGKWFTPGIGVRLGADWANAKGLTENGELRPAGGYAWYTSYYNKGTQYNGYNEQLIKYLNFNAEALFNLTNLLCGYNPDRFYNFIPHAGIGYMWSINEADSHEKELAAVGGILNTFKLSDALNLTLDLKGALFADHFSHKKIIDVNEPGKRDYIASASIGLIYKFKKRGWDRGYNKVTNVYNEEEIINLRRQLEEAKNKQPEVIEVYKERDDVFCELFNNIYFDFDKADITPESGAVLDEIAAYMIKNSNKRYLITGYTDSRGSEAYNINLSERRAKATVKALIDRGVSPDIIKTRGVGKKIAYVAPSGSDEARRGDRKVGVEFISNDAYWKLLPSSK